MLFNSPVFLFCFLPVTLMGYFILNHRNHPDMAKGWLFIASLFFYSWWNPAYLPIILGSMTFNYFVGRQLNTTNKKTGKKTILTIGVMANLGLLIFFKYTDFLIENVNGLFASELSLLYITLPLAISFFTFQQIAYLVDSYKGLTGEYSFFNYGLFVSFFPQLIAGPIVHHSEMMPQFYSKENKLFSYENFIRGIFMFFMGLGKKVIIADTFAIFANYGYSDTAGLTLSDGWVTSLAYAGQLYFDFSGYTDMAIGAALMFNIKIPINFNSPYKAQSIQDFWRRWHITLSRFLRDYIYIPLGGNRNGEYKTLSNLMITFIIGGIWHGAGWTFVFWGFLHGAALIVHRVWQRANIRLPKIICIILTFNFVNIAWIFFRAEKWSDAINVLSAMFGFGTASNFTINVITDIYSLPIALFGIILLFHKNTNELLSEFKPSKKYLAQTVGLVMMGLLFLNSITANDFLYFDF
ncbi:MBOAT family protein [Fulvivirgaceae bacterium BMA10]|uniref:MBOAT family protein n=1 Tax=Splendidivirga corallicola TaxID=3051826 RepID=A0ABT8KJF9_9BACT|nr:MBOAT family protein [Fulvivirgaceae bacterium BMA10]